MINVIIGEGGSGGALGIATGDLVYMLQFAYYSVITPEGCSAILYKNSDRWKDAAAALKLTAQDLERLGVIDRIIPEPLGGAHRDPKAVSQSIKEAITAGLDELGKLTPDELLERRYRKYREIGFFEEDAQGLYRELGLEGVAPPSEVP
jgi:acetyl-CoA carboxylase carboxyl transferase subunit alpha